MNLQPEPSLGETTEANHGSHPGCRRRRHPVCAAGILPAAEPARSLYHQARTTGRWYVRRHGCCWVVALMLLGGLLGKALAQTVQVTPVGQWPGHARGPAYGVVISGSYAYVAAAEAGLMVIDVSSPADPAWVGGISTMVPSLFYEQAYGVTVAGNYAYVAVSACDAKGSPCFSSLQVIDVRDPANPVWVGGCDTPGDVLHVAAAGNYAYLAITNVDGSGSLQVIDVSNPAKPVRMGRCDTPGSARGVAVVGDHAYVADGAGALQVVDVRDPAKPLRVGGCGTFGEPQGVAVAGNYAYVAAGDAGLQVIDVRDPANPVRVGGRSDFGSVDRVAVAGNYAYVLGGSMGLRRIDVSNPANPVWVGNYSSFRGPTMGIAVAGNYAYVAAHEGGLMVFDVKGPGQPVRVGLNHTHGVALDVAMADGYAYVADSSSGLEVIDVQNPTNPVWVGAFASDSYQDWSAQAMAVTRDRVYVVTDYGALNVLEVRSPAKPVLVGSSAGIQWLTGISAMSVVSNRAYVASVGALQVVDVSNPSNPVLEGSASTWDWGDQRWVRGVAVAGNYAYVAAGSDLLVIDVSNRANPVRVGIAGLSFLRGNAYGVAVAANYAYVAIGTRPAIGDLQGSMQVIDVTNPTRPVRVGGCDTPGYAVSVVARGGYAYVATQRYRSGSLQVIDVRNPANPTWVGGHDTLSWAQSVAVAGNYAYVAVMDRGLQIFHVGRPPVPPPTLASVRAQQRPGTTLVDVDYELGPAGGEAAAVSVAFSRNGGLSYDLAPQPGTLSGAAGGSVTSGTRRLTWDAGQTLPAGTFGSNFRARLTATSPGGSVSTESAGFALDLNRQPDLVVENVVFNPAALVAGGPVTVSFRIRNLGPGACVATQARLRLSADNVLTRYDLPLAPLDVFIPSLAAGGQHDFNGGFTVPTITPAGNYYVGVFADQDNRANQRDVVNDAGLSAARLRVDGGGVARPLITRQPLDQTVTASETVVFSVEATGSGALSFQWRFEGNRIVGATGPRLTLAGVTLRQAGIYTVEVSNAGGTTASDPARLTVNPSPDAPIPLPTRPTSGILLMEGFDPSWPTVVISHGWQLLQLGWKPEPPEWMTEMKVAVENRLRDEGSPPQRANVLLYWWPDAWTWTVHQAGAFAFDEGFALARQLDERLPSDYTGKLHFIGHSFGTVVNAVAVNQLLNRRRQLVVHQVTLLDAPILAAGVDENTYHGILVPDERVLWVDNYIADLGTGRFIWGTAPNGGFVLPSSHSAITDWYTESIKTSDLTWGFRNSVLLPGWENRPEPQEWSASLRPTTLKSALMEGGLTALDGVRAVEGVVEDSVWSGTVWLAGKVLNQNRGVVRLITSLLPMPAGQVRLAGPDDPGTASSAFAMDVAIPEEATTLAFDFLFTDPGQGDWLTVEFNDDLLWSFRGEEFFGAELQRTRIPVGHLAGRAGVITVTLHRAGAASAEALVSGFEFQGPDRPRLEAPRQISNAAFGFDLAGGLANQYRVESSTNLMDWQGLTNVLCTVPRVTITDTPATGVSLQFYRAVSVP